MFSKNVYFSAFFLLYCGGALASARLIPSEHFFSRYDKASVVVVGKFSETAPSELAITELGNFPSDKFRKGKFVVEVSWKKDLKPGTILDVFYFPLKDTTGYSIEDQRLTASEPGRDKMLIYIREIGGKNVVASKFGYYPITKLFGKTEIAALDLLKKGASETEVINVLDYSEKNYLLRQIKERGKIDISE